MYRHWTAAFVWLMLAAAPARGQDLKVFISIDMEGIAGVVTGDEVNARGVDYAHFRKIMADEAMAAARAATEAGATHVLVRDSHGGKRNLLPGDLNLEGVSLLRGATPGPRNMMEGIDETFDAVIFLGYHAKAGTPNAILEHTSNGNVIDFSINGVSLPEAGYNALVAGLYDVPVVFISGDRAFVDQANELFGPVEAVATKREIDGGALSLSPIEAQRRIFEGVKTAVENRALYTPFKLEGPYTMVLKVRRDKPLIEGAERSGPGETTFRSESLLDILDAFNAMK